MNETNNSVTPGSRRAVAEEALKTPGWYGGYTCFRVRSAARALGYPLAVCLAHEADYAATFCPEAFAVCERAPDMQAARDSAWLGDGLIHLREDLLLAWGELSGPNAKHLLAQVIEEYWRGRVGERP